MLVYFLGLKILWFRFQVGKHDTIHYKLSVVWSIAEVTTVCQITFAIFGVIVHSLVYPIPDGTAAEEVGRFDSIPVINQVTASITHRVCIFRDVERIFDVIIPFHSATYPWNGRILVRTHVYNVVVTFILNRARFVGHFQCIVCCYEVLTRAGFIS